MLVLLKATLLTATVAFQLATADGSLNLPAGCRPVDEDTDVLVNYVKVLSTMAVPARDSAGLTGVDSSTVSVVSDSTICAAAIAAVDSAFGSSPTVDSAIVVKAGAVYAVVWPNTSSERTSNAVHFVDDAFRYRISFVGY